MHCVAARFAILTVFTAMAVSANPLDVTGAATLDAARSSTLFVGV